MTKKSSGGSQYVDIKIDIGFPPFLKQLQEIDPQYLEEFSQKIVLIQKMTWDDVYKTSSKGRNKRGLNYEQIDQKTDDDKNIASIRITGKHRARVCRDGIWMRFISLHPDHDSAYKK